MFDESSSSDSEPITSLRVNERFAEDFERRKRKQELAKAREAGLIDADGNIIQASDESSSESEDDDGALLSPETDLHIIKTLEAIRSKNPAIYKKDQAWFTEGDDSSDEAEGEANTAGKRQSRKKVTARDVIGQQVAEAAALGKSEVFDEEGEEEEDGGRGDEDDAPVNMYDEEQKRLREEFLKSVKKEAEDDSGSSDDEFLQVKPATREHLAATLPELLEDEKIAKALEPTEKESIQRFIKEPAQDEAEAFLKDYLLHRRWEAKDE
ncbi:KRI1, partial [Symbiodinium sp. KB8]